MRLSFLLLLTALCGFTVAHEVQEDAGQFDRFLMATAECKMSSTKPMRVSCIIEQVVSSVKQLTKIHHFDWQVEAYVMDQFTPSTMAQRFEATVSSWKSLGSPNLPLRVSKSLKRPYPSVTRVAKARWPSQLSQRKLLATGVLPIPTCAPTATPV